MSLGEASSPAQATEVETEAPKAPRWAWVTAFLMPALAALGPFASIAPGSEGAPYFYRVLIAAAIVPALVALRVRRRRDFRVTALFLTTLGFAVWGTYGLSWTPNPERGSRQLIGVLIGLLGAWVIVGLAARYRDVLPWMRRGFVLAAVILCGIGAWQWFTGENLWVLTGNPFNFAGNPLIGTFVNPNNLAAFLLGCLGPLLAVSLGKGWRAGVFGVALLGLIAWVMLNTFSRAGLVGLFVIVALGLVIFTTSRPKSQVPIWGTSLALGIVSYWAIGDRLRTSVDATLQSSSQASDSLRLVLSRIALEYFVDSGGLGIGPAGYQVRLAEESRPEVDRILPVHNTFFEMAAEYGVPVILPFFALIVALVFGVLRVPALDANGQVNTVRLELLAGLVAVVAGALVASSLIADPSWWLLIGYLVAVHNATTGRDEERVPTEPPGESIAAPAD